MTDLVTLRREGNIGVIVIDNPPVNAFSAPARAGVLAALLRASDDAAIEAIVLRCAGRTFIAGADISEFGKPPQPPSFPEVIRAIEACAKPVVAAMHGTALGGGLEVALGCHYRVAVPGTRLALPEIKLGLIPGAGGTQRLPRLVGIEKGLAMILSGDPIPAEEAPAVGAGRCGRRRPRRRRDQIRARDRATTPASARPRQVRQDRAVRRRSGGVRCARQALSEAGEAAQCAGGRDRRHPRRADAELRRGARARTHHLRRVARRRAVKGAASYLLRRAVGGEGRSAGRREGAQGRACGHDRGGDDGGRHRDVFRQCRHSGEPDRSFGGGPGARTRRDCEKLSRHGLPRRPCAGRNGSPLGAD